MDGITDLMGISLSKSSRSWWWTGKPGMLQSTGLQGVRHNWATELTEVLLRYGSHVNMPLRSHATRSIIDRWLQLWSLWVHQCIYDEAVLFLWAAFNQWLSIMGILKTRFLRGTGLLQWRHWLEDSPLA